jgi:Reverse transcriptase (RNA-dependent DNA polymerase)
MNDILLIESTEKILKIKQMIHSLYKMKDLDQAALFLSIQIEQLLNNQIKLSQIHYIKKLLECFDMIKCHKTHLLMKQDLQNDNNEILSDDKFTDYQVLVDLLN